MFQSTIDRCRPYRLFVGGPPSIVRAAPLHAREFASSPSWCRQHFRKPKPSQNPSPRPDYLDRAVLRTRRLTAMVEELDEHSMQRLWAQASKQASQPSSPSAHSYPGWQLRVTQAHMEVLRLKAQHQHISVESVRDCAAAARSMSGWFSMPNSPARLQTLKMALDVLSTGVIAEMHVLNRLWHLSAKAAILSIAAPFQLETEDRLTVSLGFLAWAFLYWPLAQILNTALYVGVALAKTTFGRE